MTIGMQRAAPRLPVSGLRDYILGLASVHGVSYVETPANKLADTITRLSNDEVHLHEIERLLIALERAGVVASDSVVPLHINYLREKLLPEGRAACVQRGARRVVR